MGVLTCRGACRSGGVDRVGGGATGPGVAALGGGDVGLAAEPGEVEVGVAQRGQQLRLGAGVDPRAVLTVSHIPDVVVAIFDSPMILQRAGQQGGVGLAVIQGGDRVDDLAGALAGRVAGAGADDPDDLCGVRKQAVDTGIAVGGEYGDRAGLDPSVPALASDLPADLGPGQPGERG